MRRLIINADDFGLTAGVNRGILEAHRAGPVTSTTLMANGHAFAEAARLASAEPRLSVGCHIVLVDGEPLLPPQEIPTLAGEGPGFRGSVVDFARAALGKRIRPEEIVAEASAQIRKLQQHGVTVSHLDTHKHVHIFPPVLAPLLQAARACGVPAVRNPYAPVLPVRLGHLARRPRLWKRFAQVGMLRQLGTRFRQSVEAEGMVTTDGTFGIVGTGALDQGLFAAILEAIPEGTWEFVCHPGYNDAELASVRTRLRASRERELRVLTAPESRVLLEQRNIQLISYRDLSANHQITKSLNR